MAARHLLYLTNENTVSLVAHGGRITGRTVLPVHGTSVEEFEARVKELRKAPTHVITDLAEEDFRLDTIPHLGSRDQATVVARKLSQIFRNTAYRHAIVQGRETEGRRDDRVMYTAVTNAEILQPWVEVLERLEVPVEGIHSSAVFSGRLLSELHLVFPHTLLVTFTPGDAVRQTYFRNKEIKFSRLTPVDLQEGQTLGELLSEEVGRTWQYLDSQRYFGPADRLEVCVLIHPKDRPSVEPMLRDYDQILYRLLDTGQVADKLGLKPPPASSSAEEILAHLFLKRAGDNHFASPELRRFAVLRHVRNGIGWTAGAIFAAGLAYGGWNVSAALEGATQDARTAGRILTARRELDEITRSMPTQDVGGQAMRDSVAFYNGWLRDYPSMADILVPVSRVLDRYPKIRLTQVAWESADQDQGLPALTPYSVREAPPLKAIGKGQDPGTGGQRPPPGIATDPPFATGRHAVALLEGTVAVEGMGFRDALSTVESLVEDLAKLPGFRAGLVDSPLDVTPRSTIQAKIGESAPGASLARFSIRVSRPTEPRS